MKTAIGWYVARDLLSKVLILVMVVVLVFLIVSTSIIIFELKPQVSWSTKGLNELLSMFRIPITSGAALLGLLTLYLSNERTVKMNAQLKIAESSNFLNNFQSLASKFEEGERVRTKPGSNVFDLFPNLNKGIYELEPFYLDEFSKLKSLCEVKAKEILEVSALKFLESVAIANRLSEKLHDTTIEAQQTKKNNFPELQSYVLNVTDQLLDFFSFLSIWTNDIDLKLIKQLKIKVSQYRTATTITHPEIGNMLRGQKPVKSSGNPLLNRHYSWYKLLYANHQGQAYGSLESIPYRLNIKQEEEYKKMHKALAYFSWEEQLPLKTIESPEFRELLKS